MIDQQWVDAELDCRQHFCWVSGRPSLIAAELVILYEVFEPDTLEALPVFIEDWQRRKREARQIELREMTARDELARAQYRADVASKAHSSRRSA